MTSGQNLTINLGQNLMIQMERLGQNPTSQNTCCEARFWPNFASLTVRFRAKKIVRFWPKLKFGLALWFQAVFCAKVSVLCFGFCLQLSGKTSKLKFLKRVRIGLLFPKHLRCFQRSLLTLKHYNIEALRELLGFCVQQDTTSKGEVTNWTFQLFKFSNYAKLWRFVTGQPFGPILIFWLVDMLISSAFRPQSKEKSEKGFCTSLFLFFGFVFWKVSGDVGTKANPSLWFLLFNQKPFPAF